MTLRDFDSLAYLPLGGGRYLRMSLFLLGYGPEPLYMCSQASIERISYLYTRSKGATGCGWQLRTSFRGIVIDELVKTAHDFPIVVPRAGSGPPDR